MIAAAARGEIGRKPSVRGTAQLVFRGSGGHRVEDEALNGPMIKPSVVGWSTTFGETDQILTKDNWDELREILDGLNMRRIVSYCFSISKSNPPLCGRVLTSDEHSHVIIPTILNILLPFSEVTKRLEGLI